MSYRRGSLRGSIFLIGMLMYFLYIGATYTFPFLQLHVSGLHSIVLCEFICHDHCADKLRHTISGKLSNFEHTSPWNRHLHVRG